MLEDPSEQTKKSKKSSHQWLQSSQHSFTTPRHSGPVAFHSFTSTDFILGPSLSPNPSARDSALPESPPSHHPRWGIPLGPMAEWPTQAKVIGQGAFGKVYKTRDALTNKEVAIKVVNRDMEEGDFKDLTMEPAVQKIFRDNDNIVKIEGVVFNQQKNLMFIVLEYCNSGSLHEDIIFRKEEQKPYTLEELKDFCCQVLTGLFDLDSLGKGFCHLDLKPKNICLHKAMNHIHYKIVDFGLADKPGNFDDYIVGTRGYIAPEIYADTTTSERGTKCDIFSFGCILFEMVTFSTLIDVLIPNLDNWTGDKLELGEEFCLQIKVEAYLRFLDNRPNCPYKEINDIIKRCLKYNPEDRPSATELLEKLGESPLMPFRPLKKTISIQDDKLPNLDWISKLSELDRATKKSFKQAVEKEITCRDKIETFSKINYSGCTNSEAILTEEDHQYFGQI